MKHTLLDLSRNIGELLKQKNLMLATAESCTGGQVAETITTTAGCSQWFDRGLVTYSNLAKYEMLGVQPLTLTQHGAVSAEVASEMAEGALSHSHAQVSLAVTGIAGPEGGSLEKPVGTVWFAWAGIGMITSTQQQLFTGDRFSIREQATFFALQQLHDLLSSSY